MNTLDYPSEVYALSAFIKQLETLNCTPRIDPLYTLAEKIDNGSLTAQEILTEARENYAQSEAINCSDKIS